ncbi:two-component system sensor histidine kinase NtrB, partial [Desulfosarcina cetonica]|uniref:two-component system sensor histidine kinase NtrB n=1 Tax=Desulfosarcina cetonica TaxID=90730 RepID=UPI0012EEDFFB
TPRANARATVYLAMNLTAYAAARQADLHHAMIMGAIVLALGGGVIYFFIVLRSYYRLSKTLQETRDYTRQIIASMVHGVLSIDAAGIVTSCNRQARTLLGIPAAERDRIDLRTIFDFAATGIARTLTQGAPVLGQEVEISRKAAAPLPLLLTVTPIQDEAGDRNGAVVVLRDLSEIKRLEEKVRRAEKLAAIGRLAAGVAHEIRNPLSSIRGFAYWLGKDQGEHATRREYADVMVREIDRINRVVTDLLNFARPMTLEPKAIRVIDLIDHVVSLVSAEAERQSIDIQVAVTEDLPPLFIDPHQVTQALLNLLLNAMGGLEAGGAIRLRASVEDEGQTAVFHVEDNGPGIDPAIRGKIFEPFFTTRERGTGLGLAMVRKIAENHDGEILLESPPPGKAHGACFTLRLRSTPASRIAGSEEENPDPDDPALMGERP